MTAVFVFGSNLAGAHGGGAAAVALMQHGAVWGQASGLQGSSYAIPTCDRACQPLPLEKIAAEVTRFIEFARSRPDVQFNVTRVGCGIAGFTDYDIAPMFREAPDNCALPVGWRSLAVAQ